MAKEKDGPKKVRRMQSLGPYNTGAVVEAERESFAVADIRFWGEDGELLQEPRLQALLGVKNFRTAQPAPDDSNSRASGDRVRGIPVTRFPKWMFCAICRNMRKLSDAPSPEAPKCTFCKSKPPLVPMRFVLACSNGHLDDVPWDLWCHSKSSKRCERSTLKFNTTKGGGGLEFLEIRCTACDSWRHLGELPVPDSMKKINRGCRGLQPWQKQGRDAEACDRVPQVLQRGATNVTFAETISSIDIPPYSLVENFEGAEGKVKSSSDFKKIIAKVRKGDVTSETLRSDRQCNDAIWALSDEYAISEDEVIRIIRSYLGDASDTVKNERDLVYAEWEAFHTDDRDLNIADRFVKRTTDPDAYIADIADDNLRESLQALWSRLGTVARVVKLREVRVLKGFSRLAPAETEMTAADGTIVKSRLVPADLNTGVDWLPAIEVFGEGIFITLNEVAVQQWSERTDVISRASKVEARRSGSFGSLPARVTPRFVLLHTLAHLLIRQLSFECGYSLASLRERIYCAEPDEDGYGPMAGILLYTSAGDTEGTMGGLSRQGQPPRLFRTLTRALQEAEWCSADPVCRESKSQGPGGLNLAACHACALLPETSCVYQNRVLDRVTVTGDVISGVRGYFEM